MALTRVTSAGIADGALTVDDIANGAIHTAKLADAAVHSVKIADDAVTPAKVDETGSFTVSELTISGTSALQVPTGTEAQRPSSGLTNGLLRFNTTAGKLEVYNTTKAKWEAAGGGGGGASAGLAFFAAGW
jgi:hypothetical protein